MWKLVKKNLGQREKLFYFFNVVLIVYIIGASLACRFNELMPAINFLPTLGTAVNFVTDIMIIMAATAFSGNRSREQIHGFLASHLEKQDIFWSKVIALGLQYLDLLAVDVIVSILTQQIIFHGKYLGAHSLYIMAITASANVIYVFVLASATILFGNMIKSISGTVAAGIGFQYFGEIPMGGFMILVYHHRWLKWNPFNILFVQNQITKPINHTMTKMTMLEIIIDSLFYGTILLLFAYFAFERYAPFHKDQVSQEG